jgi:hypothetical protein
LLLGAEDVVRNPGEERQEAILGCCVGILPAEELRMARSFVAKVEEVDGHHGIVPEPLPAAKRCDLSVLMGSPSHLKPHAASLGHESVGLALLQAVGFAGAITQGSRLRPVY